MCRVLLSVKPFYAFNIMRGYKKWEFRRRIPKCKVDSIVFYASAPWGQVVCEVEVLGLVACDSAKSLWERTVDNRGIGYDAFVNYFRGSRWCYAFELGKVTIFDGGLPLSAFGVKRAPQSFVYLPEKVGVL
jgi:predicted transcriptional regulator